MKVAIVLLNSLQIPCVYDAPEPQQALYGGDWGSPQVTVHMEVPESLDPQCLMATRDDSGEITLQEDPAKVEAKTAQAWTSLRSQRNQLLAASDWTRLDDVSLTDEQKAQWAEYRAALRDVTKGLEDPTQVQWPTRPSP